MTGRPRADAPARLLAEEDFVALTTYRRSGEPVSTPVWVAGAGDELVVTTPAATGKVRRLRRDDRVTLVPCSRRGRIRDGAEPVRGRASVEERAAEVERLSRHLAGKYGWEYRVVMGLERVLGRRRGKRVILRIDADADADADANGRPAT